MHQFIRHQPRGQTSLHELGALGPLLHADHVSRADVTPAPDVVPLAQAGVSIFVISTHDTDYLLVRGRDFDRAREVLAEHGHRFNP